MKKTGKIENRTNTKTYLQTHVYKRIIKFLSWVYLNAGIVVCVWVSIVKFIFFSLSVLQSAKSTILYTLAYY